MEKIINQLKVENLHLAKKNAEQLQIIESQNKTIKELEALLLMYKV